ncbi:MAG: hypothetical protein AB1746_05610 [Candidatus Zixiibacteriota bacterium]
MKHDKKEIMEQIEIYSKRIRFLLKDSRSRQGYSLQKICDKIGLGLKPSSLLYYEANSVSAKSIRLINLLYNYNIELSMIFEDNKSTSLIEGNKPIEEIIREKYFKDLISELSKRNHAQREIIVKAFVHFIRTMDGRH